MSLKWTNSHKALKVAYSIVTVNYYNRKLVLLNLEGFFYLLSQQCSPQAIVVTETITSILWIRNQGWVRLNDLNVTTCTVSSGHLLSLNPVSQLSMLCSSSSGHQVSPPGAERNPGWLAQLCRNSFWNRVSQEAKSKHSANVFRNEAPRQNVTGGDREEGWVKMPGTKPICCTDPRSGYTQRSQCCLLAWVWVVLETA